MRKSNGSIEKSLIQLEAEIVACRRCPRLVEWRERVACEKKREFMHCDYWGKPVPGWGDPAARLVIVGLAPAAHGANRTGRMFTGDRSGEWLYRALFKAGFANQARSEGRVDGLKLTDCWITAPVRCAPPGNKPEPAEFANCAEWIGRELELLKNAEILVGLGKIGFEQAFLTWNAIKGVGKRTRPKFGHGAVAELEGGGWLIGSFHPSQQNTFTGKLTEKMLDGIFVEAKKRLEWNSNRNPQAVPLDLHR